MTTKSRSYHEPVLLQPCLEGLSVKAGGIYVDATFGGGGHAKAILNEESDLRLFGFDQDPDALANVPKDDRFTLIPENFRYLQRFLRLEGVNQVDGILADLGVSSHQFDTPERGFSIRFEGPLDMRMNPEVGMSAAELIANSTKEELQQLFSEFGEVRNARTLAEAIINEQNIAPLSRTEDLVRVAGSVAKGPANKYLAQVFQALRIAVNDEVLALKEFLEQSLEVLRPGGRLVVISYHSLEDRLVKQFMKWGGFGAEPEKDLYGNFPQPFKQITRKPIIPDDREVQINPRARSARLRIAEKK